jgi:hypothetical protein
MSNLTVALKSLVLSPLLGFAAAQPAAVPQRPTDATTRTSVRSINLRDFRALCDRASAAHGERPELLELRSRAEMAFARFPVPVLGPGMARQIAAMSDGADAFRNVLDVVVGAEKRLRSGDCVDCADAIVRAFAAFRRMTLEETRKALIEASRDCEFFSPELVLLLVALRY